GSPIKFQSREILRVLFCGDKCLGASISSRLRDSQQVSRRVTVMIGKDSAATNCESPRLKIPKEGLGIAQPAKGKKRAAADFLSRLELDARTITPESY